MNHPTYQGISREVLKNLGRESVIYQNSEIEKASKAKEENDPVEDDPWIPMDGSFSPIIQDVTKKFISTSGHISIGIHWRYNQDDWSKRCDLSWTKGGVRENPPECNLVTNLDFDKLALNLLDMLMDLNTDVTTFDINGEKVANIYIAAPPSEITFIKSLSRHVNFHIKENKNYDQIRVKIYQIKDLTRLMFKHYSRCPWFSKYQSDAISLAEQAILTQVSAFYFFNTQSSWGKRVVDRRRFLGRLDNLSIIPVLEKSQNDSKILNGSE